MQKNVCIAIVVAILLVCIANDTRDPAVLMMAFNTYVRPILEYATVVWSPFLKKNIRKLEVVQKTVH